ncbi:MAG: T9SS type A sorting domain-containing protein, partial [Thermoanaerobaculia bacterium]
NLAALDPVTGLATTWVANANSQVFALATIEDTLYVGGGFYSIGNQPRNGLAALDIATGDVFPWNPNLSLAEWQGQGTLPGVRTIVPIGQTLLVGGGFNRIGEALASNVATISFGPPPTPTPPPHALMFAGLMPNPVRGAAIVRFSLPQASPVSLMVFDLQGRRVASLLEHTVRPAGTNDVALRTDAWREGFYFCRLEAGGVSATRKFVVLK